MLPVSAGSVTPSLGETDAVFLWPGGPDPVKLIVLTRSRELPLEIPATGKDRWPFIREVVDEEVKLPIAVVRDQANSDIGKRIRGINERRIGTVNALRNYRGFR